MASFDLLRALVKATCLSSSHDILEAGTGKVMGFTGAHQLPMIAFLRHRNLVFTPLPHPLQGIGNTFQGGANCIMFVLCTRAVRTRLFSLCCCCPRPSTQSPPGAPTPPKIGESQESRRTPEVPST